MSDDSFSDDDMDAGDVGEGACVRVVQSSLHASIMQNSLFKVVEKQQESEDEKPENTEDKAQKPESPKEQRENFQGKPEIFEEKIEEKPANPLDSFEISANDDQYMIRVEDFSENINKEILSNHQKEPFAPILIKLTSPILKSIFDEEPKKKKRKKLDVKKRFYDFKAKVTEKIALLKEEKDSKESEICTFQPKTSSNPKDLKFSHFLNHMEKAKDSQLKALEKLQADKATEEQERSCKLFKPVLSKMTNKLASKRHSSVDLHEKLFKEYEELKKKKEKESKAVLDQICTFKPALGKRTSELKREGLATDRLYQDLKSKKSQIFPIIERKSEKLISESSELILKEKFLKEFDSHFSSLHEGQSFEDFLKSLEKIGFVREGENKSVLEDRDLAKKAWTGMLKDESDKVDSNSIKQFLLSVMNFSKPSDGHFKNAFVEFRRFYENRRDRIDPDKNLKKPLNFAFKPEINPFSLELARIVKEKRMNSYSTDKPEKVLQLIQKSAKDKLKEERERMKDKGLEDCTFRPQTVRGPLYSEESWTDSESLASNYLKLLNEGQKHRCDLLYSFSKIESEKKEKEMRSVDDMEIEKNMGECTFTPNLEKRLLKNQKDSEVKGVKKVIEKLRQKNKSREKSEESYSFLDDTINQLLKLKT